MYIASVMSRECWVHFDVFLVELFTTCRKCTSTSSPTTCCGRRSPKATLKELIGCVLCLQTFHRDFKNMPAYVRFHCRHSQVTLTLTRLIQTVVGKQLSTKLQNVVSSRFDNPHARLLRLTLVHTGSINPVRVPSGCDSRRSYVQPNPTSQGCRKRACWSGVYTLEILLFRALTQNWTGGDQSLPLLQLSLLLEKKSDPNAQDRSPHHMGKHGLVHLFVGVHAAWSSYALP